MQRCDRDKEAFSHRLLSDIAHEGFYGKLYLILLASVCCEDGWAIMGLVSLRLILDENCTLYAFMDELNPFYVN